MGKAINASNVIAGDGINIDYTQNGAIINMNQDIYFDRMVHVGEFCFDNEYIPGNVVDVPYTVNFNDENGDNVPIGLTTTSNYNNIPTAIGSFVCVKYVPPSYVTQEYVEQTVSLQFQNIPTQYLDGTRYYDLNVYYPIYPTIPSQYTASVECPLDSRYYVTANETFWRPIGLPASPVYGCKNGIQSVYYESQIMSGSLFDPSYLPYSG